MNTLLKYMENNFDNIYKNILEYDESKRVFNYYFTLRVIQVFYSFTNSKNGKRKEGSKYFVGSFGNITSNQVKVMLSDWVLKENRKRKYPFENVVLDSFKRVNNTIFNGEPIYSGEKFNSYIKKRRKIQDISNLKKVRSTLDFLRDKPSENPKDYVIVDGLVIKFSVANVTYRTNRNRVRNKECVVISLQNSNIESYGYNIINSIDSILYRSIKNFNSLKPWRAIELISVEEILSETIKL
ncbi:hypothetical protein ACSW8S_15150 (plasmid) [Clostridium perfringens]